MDRRNTSSLYLLEMVPREVSCSRCVVREDKPVWIVCIGTLVSQSSFECRGQYSYIVDDDLMRILVKQVGLWSIHVRVLRAEWNEGLIIYITFTIRTTGTGPSTYEYIVFNVVYKHIPTIISLSHSFISCT